MLAHAGLAALAAQAGDKAKGGCRNGLTTVPLTSAEIRYSLLPRPRADRDTSPTH
ncbi:hypothetical protein GCM10009730_51100 [Streptomyces albidochromogenes]